MIWRFQANIALTWTERKVRQSLKKLLQKFPYNMKNEQSKTKQNQTED